jgi:excisionase family DNA binding protein
MSDFLRPEEAAVRLGVSTATIRRWITIGRLPSVKIGRTIRIPQKSINDLLTVKPTDGALVSQ